MDKRGCYDNLPASINCFSTLCISSENFVIVKKERNTKASVLHSFKDGFVWESLILD